MMSSQLGTLLRLGRRDDRGTTWGAGLAVSPSAVSPLAVCWARLSP
jgi:hypothetical protein